MRIHSKLMRHVWLGAIAIGSLSGLISPPPAASAQPAQIIIDDTRVFPESLTSTATGTIIIGSLDHGTIYRALRGTAKATPWIAAASDGLTRTLGVFAHDPSNTLWVCTNHPDTDVNKADLKAYDLKTATLKAHYPFPGGGFCNDIAIGRNGTVYATDTRGGRILSLKRGAGALTIWGADDKWKGIDGISMLRNGSVLFNNVRENQLVRVEVKSDGTSGRAVLLDLSQLISGPDGMRSLPDGRLILAENKAGKIDIVTVKGNRAQIDTIKDGFKFTPTAVTVVGRTAWVLEAKFAYRNDPAMKDKDPGEFGATAMAMPGR
jgi:hypothetical protein